MPDYNADGSDRKVDPYEDGEYETEAERVFEEEEKVLVHHQIPDWVDVDQAIKEYEEIVIAELRVDTVQEDNSENRVVPFVVRSTHPDFPDGTRLDFGLIQAALEDGYHVFILNNFAPHD